MKTPMVVVAAALAMSAAFASPLSVVVDTDSSVDDLIAVAYLLRSPEVRVTGIVTVAGVARPEIGAAHMRGLLKLAGRADIPVVVGASAPIKGDLHVPPSWRETAETLPGVSLPQAEGPAPAETPRSLYRKLLRERGATTVLALGPLTNLARLLRSDRAMLERAAKVVVMGGAIRVLGNLPEEAGNRVAEWNVSADPVAARELLRSPVAVSLVPLDATNKVRIDESYIAALADREGLGHLVHDLLAIERPAIDAGQFYAWDPLAAASVAHPGLLTYECGRFDVSVAGANRGQVTFRLAPGANHCFASKANSDAFRSAFLETFR